jgi:ABC-type transporter Mla maintaining outer membrane lipid asymmetry ATPase subunit MlaF
MAESPIIRVENFTAAYDGNVIINDISFDVQRGEVFVILGGSGCGKSTLPEAHDRALSAGGGKDSAGRGRHRVGGRRESGWASCARLA